jgi:hypothetical protein
MLLLLLLLLLLWDINLLGEEGAGEEEEAVLFGVEAVWNYVRLKCQGLTRRRG